MAGYGTALLASDCPASEFYLAPTGLTSLDFPALVRTIFGACMEETHKSELETNSSQREGGRKRQTRQT